VWFLFDVMVVGGCRLWSFPGGFVWSGAFCGRLVGFPLSGIAVFLFVSPAVVGGAGGALPSPGGARMSLGWGGPGGEFLAPLFVLFCVFFGGDSLVFHRFCRFFCRVPP